MNRIRNNTIQTLSYIQTSSILVEYNCRGWHLRTNGDILISLWLTWKWITYFIICNNRKCTSHRARINIITRELWLLGLVQMRDFESLLTIEKCVTCNLDRTSLSGQEANYSLYIYSRRKHNVHPYRSISFKISIQVSIYVDIIVLIHSREKLVNRMLIRKHRSLL